MLSFVLSCASFAFSPCHFTVLNAELIARGLVGYVVQPHLRLHNHHKSQHHMGLQQQAMHAQMQPLLPALSPAHNRCVALQNTMLSCCATLLLCNCSCAASHIVAHAWLHSTLNAQTDLVVWLAERLWQVQCHLYHRPCTWTTTWILSGMLNQETVSAVPVCYLTLY